VCPVSRGGRAFRLDRPAARDDQAAGFLQTQGQCLSCGSVPRFGPRASCSAWLRMASNVHENYLRPRYRAVAAWTDAPRHSAIRLLRSRGKKEDKKGLRATPVHISDLEQNRNAAVYRLVVQVNSRRKRSVNRLVPGAVRDAGLRHAKRDLSCSTSICPLVCASDALHGATAAQDTQSATAVCRWSVTVNHRYADHPSHRVIVGKPSMRPVGPYSRRHPVSVPTNLSQAKPAPSDI